MKFLLTSEGLTDKTITKALLDLAGHPAGKLDLAFIPTAANVEKDDKGWLIDHLYRIKKQGFRTVDIVDISAIPRDMWQPRLEAANILFFGGGNSFHLMYWLKKSGLAGMLPTLLRTRVYAGISAGGMVTGPSLSLHQSEQLYYEDVGQYTDNAGMGFVPLHFRPHLNSPFFPKVTKKHLSKLSQMVREPVYALDDRTALKVVNEKINIVGPGKHLIFNVGV